GKYSGSPILWAKQLSILIHADKNRYQNTRNLVKAAYPMRLTYDDVLEEKKKLHAEHERLWNSNQYPWEKWHYNQRLTN
ncbi:MAG: hypothetical protein RLP12_08475, partial [Ekhidna sp.]